MKNLFTLVITQILVNLQLFANLNTNVTTDGGLSAEMKTFYDMQLIDEATANLVHDQFGQKRPIPANSGKTIEFRKFAALAKSLTPITEGVTPDGKKLTVTAITATVSQYGDYIVQSDVLELTTIDNTILEATKLLGRQAGLTLDTITRNILHTGTNVSYAPQIISSVETEITSRASLNANCLLTVDLVNQVVAKLRSVNAPTINGDYVAIVHPFAVYDLMSDPAWLAPHQYVDTDGIYEGEIGKIGGVRFVQTTEAKIYRGEGLTAGSRTLTVKTAIAESTTTVAVTEKITSDDVTAFAARDDEDKYVYLANGTKLGVASLTAGAAGSASLTLSEAIASLAKDAVLAPVGGTAGDLAVFGTLFIAEGAYGVTEITGGGLQTIIKQKGSAGTADPLDQRSSVGWKAIKTAKILVEDYMVRVESVSKRFSSTAVAN